MRRCTTNFLAIGLLFLIAVPAAWSGGRVEPEDATAPDVELEVWAMRDDWLIDTLEFEARNPGVRVNWEVVPWEVHLDRLLAAAETNDLPDVVAMDRGWKHLFYTRGLLRPLNDHIADWELAGDITESTWDAVTFGDDIVGVPYTYLSRFLYYRVDWFEEAGVPHPPETWDDLIAAGLALQEHGFDAWGFTFRGRRDGGTTSAFWPIFESFGGTWDMNEAPEIDSQAGRNALQLYYDLVNTYEISSPETITFGSSEARGMFPAGRTAMGWYLTHIVQSVLDAGLEYGEHFLVAEMPKASPEAERTNYVYVNAWVNFATSDHPDESWDLIAYMAEDEPMLDFGLRYMDVPRQSLLSRDEYEDARPWIPVLLDTMDYGKPQPDWENYEEVNSIYQEMIQRVLSGDATPDEAIRRAVSEIDQQLR